jgi:hypothetical protein
LATVCDEQIRSLDVTVPANTQPKGLANQESPVGNRRRLARFFLQEKSQATFHPHSTFDGLTCASCTDQAEKQLEEAK